MTIRPSTGFFTLAGISFLLLFTSLRSTGPEIVRPFSKGGDTLKAEVTYGNTFLLAGNTEMSDPELLHLIDSLSRIPEESSTCESLRFYASIRKKNAEDIEGALDSLFRLDSIPYGLINELNLLLLQPREYLYPASLPILSFRDNHQKFPCHDLYASSWNQHHPFQDQVPLTDFDSLFLLPLQTQINGYHCPVSNQTIRKYGIRVGSPFGWRDGKNHNGIDIELDQWDSIPCAFNGVVRFAKNYSGYGKVVIVRHYNGLETLYAHMARINVKTGQSVKAGQLLGLGGSTGNSTGSHLHFEVRYKNIPVNPANIIDFREGQLLSDTLMLRKMRNSFVCTPTGVHFHTVERGDYPHKIANRYGLTVQQLCEMNNISPRMRLRIGQRLRVSS